MTDPVQHQLITARRNQILDAAATVFARKGYHPTTIKDIAGEAGIADGTIYNYFKNKTALLIGIFERMRDNFVVNDAPPQLDTLDLREFIHIFVAQPLIVLKRDNFELFRVVVSEMMVNADLRRLYQEQIVAPTMALPEAYFEAMAARGEISAEDIQLKVRLITSIVMGVIVQSVIGDALIESHWDSLPDLMTDLLINGLKGNNS